MFMVTSVGSMFLVSFWLVIFCKCVCVCSLSMKFAKSKLVFIVHDILGEENYRKIAKRIM